MNHGKAWGLKPRAQQDCALPASLKHLHRIGGELVLVDLAALHDEVHVLEHRFVRERVALDGDEVGVEAGGELAAPPGDGIPNKLARPSKPPPDQPDGIGNTARPEPTGVQGLQARAPSEGPPRHPNP